MNKSSDKILNKTAACGCCEGISVLTPAEINNRPGLKAIAYRTGTHALFKKSMLAYLASSKFPTIKKLTTRKDDDFSIALLDAWATVSDVLTFYQERIVNESYLRTAVERLSIQQLARLTGYELSPGSAASTYLAFTVDESTNLPQDQTKLTVKTGLQTEITIDKGTKVQSIPGPGEQAQTFETVEEIKARPEWNAIKPRLKKRHKITRNTSRLFLEGTNTNLKAGDGIAFKALDDDNSVSFGIVSEITLHTDEKYTEIILNLIKEKSMCGELPGLNSATANVGAVTSKYLNKTLTSAELHAEAEKNKFDIQELFDNLNVASKLKPKVFAFRAKAGIFGHNAPEWNSLPSSLRGQEPVYKTDSDGKIIISGLKDGPFKNRKSTWAEMNLQEYIKYMGDSKSFIHLDNVYSNISKETYVILTDRKNWGIYKIGDISERSLSDFLITSKVTCLTLDKKNGFDNLHIRETSVFAYPETFSLADQEEESDFPPKPPSSIELNSWLDGLSTAQNIIISGEMSNMRGVRFSEKAEIDKVEHVLAAGGYTRITFKENLKNSYVRKTVTMNANVASATHGETVSEILGSGDSRKTFQSFCLSHKPLTYISASTASGIESTLEVRVNDILWKEVPSLYGPMNDERKYIVRTGDNGKTLIQFGDGKTGARLPSGKENVHAKYRKGSGLEGLVKAGQLKLLMTRPYGVKDVINPIDADSADEPESLDDARMNAPLKVWTLDRIVSLRDYEDFARSFTGIAKALGTWTWDGQDRGVFITVAGPKGTEITTKSKVYENLMTALKKSGAPSIPVIVKSYNKAFFKLSANIKLDSDYIDEKVLNEVKTELIKHFSFEMRDFGQQVCLSEVMAVMQSVSGVVSADVDTLARTDGKGGDGLKQPLIAEFPKAGAEGDALAAELLLLDKNTIRVGVDI
jgi:hypothetical protein